MRFRSGILFFIITICIGCAGVYRPIDPARHSYQNEAGDTDVSFSYHYNVLEETGNKKYSRKEARKGVQIVAVRIRNNSTSNVQLGKSLNLFVNNTGISIMPVTDTYKILRQSPYIYLLYLGLVPVTALAQNQRWLTPSRRTTPVIPSGYYFLGPTAAASNMFVAINSNKKFLANLKAFDLNGKIIKPGEEVYGLIGLPYNGYEPLYLEKAK